MQLHTKQNHETLLARQVLGERFEMADVSAQTVDYVANRFVGLGLLKISETSPESPIFVKTKPQSVLHCFLRNSCGHN